MRRQYAVSSARWHPLVRTPSIAAVIANLANLNAGGAEPARVPTPIVLTVTAHDDGGRRSGDVRRHGMLRRELGVNQELAPQHGPTAVACRQRQPSRSRAARDENPIAVRAKLAGMLGQPTERRELELTATPSGQPDDDGGLEPVVGRLQLVAEHERE